MMYCTGGVRCERASSYLLEHGAAKEVVQLQGGICRYLERFKDRPKFFRGKNFVFDPRRYEPIHDDTVVGRCDCCQSPWDDYDNGEEVHCEECRVLLLLCDACRNVQASNERTERIRLLCGDGVCDGERIRCGCGCGPECDSGRVCRRTGHFTRKTRLTTPQAAQDNEHERSAGTSGGGCCGCFPSLWRLLLPSLQKADGVTRR
eukprot:TRINITY_DN8043_c0_g1_i1.p1 TRINITY_DN8043_c0_g1~~TRINITY_DN8043_c0_g1_i1.p1  ORF type:complete len:204 (+),score=24.91 TRINITY_DN8043_c0_g1_i1:1074-1685(+)